jgi:hypothetical protein
VKSVASSNHQNIFMKLYHRFEHLFVCFCRSCLVACGVHHQLPMACLPKLTEKAEKIEDTQSIFLVFANFYIIFLL